jgi:agmatine deiminase
MAEKGVTPETNTPTSLGFRMPAEWEPHEATWIGWPHNKTDWPGKFATIPWVYAEIVRKLSPHEIVRILVNSKLHEASARRILTRAGVDLTRTEFFRFPTNRGWTRDFGPWFVHRSLPKPEVAITAFGFNAWARYPDWKKDALIHERAARALGCKLFRPSLNGKRIVLEGGAIDVNGSGSLLTTEECLLDQIRQPRNPGMAREEMEKVLRDYLGVTNILWLGRGIAGDDTHGHIDDVCRFVGPKTVVLCQQDDPADPDYNVLEENRERLEEMKLEDGAKLEVVRLPMPSPLHLDGQRLPASYANFYIANGVVLVPTFNDRKDRIALGILAELIPDRKVVGIHAVDLVWGLGTLHCLTREQPAASLEHDR